MNHFFITCMILINMGRKLIYKTKEEKQAADNSKAMKYYWKNRKEIKRKNLKRYYDKKLNESK